MIEYALEDKDANQYELSGTSIVQPAKGSITFLKEQFGFENKIIQNSFLPGAIKLGKTRLASSSLLLRIMRAHNDSSDFIAAQNILMEWLEKAVYLIDKTNNRRVSISISNIDVQYDEGGHKLSSENSILLEVLNPFWEATTETIVGPQALTIDINDVNLNNQGALNAYPIITFTATVACSQIEMFIVSTRHGLIINDSLFGTTNYQTLIIDCLNGTIMIGELDRSISILGGTGYFYIPPESAILEVIPSAACSITVKWRNREYV